jgi:dTDP-4-amino-4,6-dideoxygalactose transaminase
MTWKVVLADIDLGEDEIANATRVLRSRWLSMGEVTQEFERRFAAYLKVKYAFAVSSGTAALHLANMAVGIGPGDEVIVPALTFVATANAVLYCGATPIFVDITSLDDLNLSPESIVPYLTPRTRAICVVHYGGYPVDMGAVTAIAHSHGLSVIEDAAHAPGADYRGKKTGTLGDIGCFSFFANKNLVTGEGGMVVTDSDALAERLIRLRSHGMTSLSWERHQGHAHGYDVTALGYNYRITDLTSALGLAQLEKLERNNQKREAIVTGYRKRLSGITDIRIPFLTHPARSSYHLFPILAPSAFARERLMAALLASGIQISMHYPPVHLFSYYRQRFGHHEGTLPLTEEVGRRELTLPLHSLMQPSDTELVAACIEECLEATRPALDEGR